METNECHVNVEVRKSSVDAKLFSETLIRKRILKYFLVFPRKLLINKKREK